MAIVVDAACWTTKTSFTGITINQVELTPHYYSRTRLLALMHLKRTFLEAEIVIIFLEQHWEDLFFQSITGTRLSITVHKYVSTSRMPVEVTEKEYLT